MQSLAASTVMTFLVVIFSLLSLSLCYFFSLLSLFLSLSLSLYCSFALSSLLDSLIVHSSNFLSFLSLFSLSLSLSLFLFLSLSLLSFFYFLLSLLFPLSPCFSLFSLASHCYSGLSF